MPTNFWREKKQKIAGLVSNNRFLPLIDFFWFAFLIISVHIGYRFWANQLHYQIFGINMNPEGAFQFLIRQIVGPSSWFAEIILGVAHEVNGNTLWMKNHNAYVEVNNGCSGFKPMIQFFILILFFRGPWKHKLWFIPLGILAVHATNIFRIAGLAWVAVHFPGLWDWLHDWFFRPLFYVVMFLLWLWWVEVLTKKGNRFRKSSSQDPPFPTSVGESGEKN